MRWYVGDATVSSKSEMHQLALNQFPARQRSILCQIDLLMTYITGLHYILVGLLYSYRAVITSVCI